MFNLIKKTITVFILTIVSTTSVISTKINFTEISNNTSVINGVTHQKVTGESTNDNGTISNQNVNILTQGSDTEVVSWSKFQNGKYVKANTVSIAEDFENKNPGFEVVAGVNGDYFSSETTNSNVIYGNRTINPINHSKYFSIEFGLDGSFIKRHKFVPREQELNMSVIGKDNEIKLSKYISNPNKITVSKGETSYLNSSNHIYNKLNTYYELVNITEHFVGSHIYVEAEIKGIVTDIKDKKVLVSDDKYVNEVIKNGDSIIIQKQVNKSSYNSMIIGVDSQVVNNNVVTEFKDLGGQSESNNTSRHPRTGFGFNQEGKMVLFTVDGRGAGGSEGVNLRELGTIMNSYGVKNGYNLDGGGSTQAVVKELGKIRYVNTPSESNRPVGNALLLVKRKAPLIGEVKIEDQKLNVEGIDKDIFSDIRITINGKTENINTDFSTKIKKEYYSPYQNNTITLELPKVRTVVVSIVGKLKGTNQNIVLYNNIFIFDEYKDPVDKADNAELKINHLYSEKELKIILDYNDPYKTIDIIRVYLSSPEINKPVIILDENQSYATFELENDLISQEVKVVVIYKDKTVKEYLYDITIDETEDLDVPGKYKNIYLYIILSAITFIAIGTITYIIKYLKK